MSVSFFVDKAGSQEMSVSLNQGAVSLLADKLAPKESGSDGKVRNQPGQGELDISRLVESNKGAKSLSVEILKPFFSKLAQVGITLGPQTKTEAQSQKDLEEIDGKTESFRDLVEIRHNPEMVQRLKKEGQAGGGGEGGNGAQGGFQNEALAEYVGVLTEYLATQSTDLVGKLKDLKTKLIEQGVSEEQLIALEAGIKGRQAADPSETVKELLIMQLLGSDSKFETTVYTRGLNDVLAKYGPEEARDILEKARFKAKEEMQSFLPEELENALIKTTHLQDKDYTVAMKLIKYADKAGWDYQGWLNNVWPDKKLDQGVNLIDVPPAATGLVVNTSTDNPSGQSQKHGYEYEKEDEKELLINRLRALYMQRALKGDAFTFLNTEFKVRKLKNGLFKLGIMTGEMDERIQHEAEIVAKVKIIEMLKEALIERAAFYELAGPAHQLVERKIKGLLKNAERLGMPLSTGEFNLMRDTANRRVFELSLAELEDVRARRREKDDPRLEKREKLLVRLLTRLKGESEIEAAIPENC